MILSTLAILGAAATTDIKFSEVVYVLDVSGSTEISQKALRGIALETTVNQVDHYGEGNVRIALVTYGWEDESIRINPFTANTSQMLHYLAGPINGAYNAKEHGMNTTMVSLTKLPWTNKPEVKRTIIVMGNEGLRQSEHAVLLSQVAEVAKKKEILVDTVFTPFHDIAGSSRPYEELAFVANGKHKYMNEQDLKVYTDVYDYWNRFLLKQEADRLDRNAKEHYLRDLMRKKSGG